MYSFAFAANLPYIDLFIDGLINTLWLSLVICSLSLVVGSVFAILNDFGNNKIRSLYRVYIGSIRNTPLLVQLFILYFGLSTLGLILSPNFVCVLAFTIHTSAYIAEILRSGIEATPRSQIEASRCLGMTKAQTYRYIILNPAFAKVYHALISQFVLTMLGTSLASQISVSELTAEANLVASYTYRSFEAYTMAAAIYIALGVTIRVALLKLESILFRWK